MKFETIMQAWNNTQTFYLIDLGKAFGETLLAKELLQLVGQSVPENRTAMFLSLIHI